MSTLTDLFTSMANKIRSKTGTQTTYTPAEMVSDGIDDVYDAGYAAGGGGSSATSITPSNSSPVAMTANNAYEPTANGYAISYYFNVTPTSSPQAVYVGDMTYTNGTGYIINTYSSSSVSPTSSGASFSSGWNYMNSSGYAISSYSSITPSSSGTYFSSGMKYMSSSGYAYSSQMPNVKVGTFTASTSTTTSVTLGFKPKYLAVYFPISSSARTMWIYDERISTSQFVLGSSSVYASLTNLGSTSNYRLYSINSNGFTCSKIGTAGVTAYYFAIG